MGYNGTGGIHATDGYQPDKATILDHLGRPVARVKPPIGFNMQPKGPGGAAVSKTAPVTSSAPARRR